MASNQRVTMSSPALVEVEASPSPSSSLKRPRADLSSGDLSSILLPFVKSVGFIEYGTSLESSEVLPTGLELHADMLNALRRVSNDAPITQSTLVESLVLIAHFNAETASSKKWLKLVDDSKELASWAADHSFKLRTMLRHVKRSLNRSSGRPKWISRFPPLPGLAACSGYQSMEEDSQGPGKRQRFDKDRLDVDVHCTYRHQLRSQTLFTTHSSQP